MNDAAAVEIAEPERDEPHTGDPVWRPRRLVMMNQVPEGERIAALEHAIKSVHEDLHEMWSAINGARNDMSGIRTNDIAQVRREIADLRVLILEQSIEAAKRPSWVVAALVTFLCSAVVGLFVYAASTAPGH